MAKATTIRGLQVFISDIRACQNKEQEGKRVDKELAKIRGKFGDDSKSLSAYDRKKYVWKLLYIYMLGYDVEFGHKQACDLIPAQKYAEKQVGYMACSILMNEKDEFLRLSINAIHNDLISRNEAFQSIALTFVANIAGQEMAEALTPDVLKLLMSGTARPVVRKKAALCLLRLMRKTPPDAQLVTADSFASTMGRLLEERDLGLLLASVTLMLGICVRCGSAGYEQCHGKLLRLLERLVFLRDVTPDYTYYGIASPWLQIKVLRTLQYFPPPEGVAAQKQLHDVLQAIFNACGEPSKPSMINKSNAQHGILFEAIALILALDFSRDLLAASVAALARFLSVKEPNIRYLALENLARLALVPEVLDSIQEHQATVLSNLRDPDVSIRRRALDLLFTMCDGGAAVEVVEELVTYLTVADFSMREELVLKIAILAEKFAPTVQWYVDVVLALLERAGDFCSDEVWQRVAQLVTNNEASQAYAAGQVVEALRRGASHEPLLAMGAYVLGEYGRSIKDQVGGLEQFRLLHQSFGLLKPPTQALLLTAYLKLLLADPGNAALQAEVVGVLGRQAKQLDPELQQRSAEYLVLAQDPAKAAAHYVLPMPKWEGRESALLKRLAAGEGNDADALPAAASNADESLASMGTAPSSALSAALGGEGPAAPAPAPAKAAPAAAPAAAAAAASAAAPPAALPAAKAPDFDLLGGDDLVAPSMGAPVAAAPAAAAPAPAAPPKAVDPLEELFGSLSTSAPAPAPVPAAAPAAAGAYGAAAAGAAAFAAAGVGAAAAANGHHASSGGPFSPHAPPAAAGAAYGGMGVPAAGGTPTAAAWGPYGPASGGQPQPHAAWAGAAAYGPPSPQQQLQQSPFAPVAAGPASGGGGGGVSSPMASTVAAGATGSAGGGIGFEDAAFAPADNWRVLGDVAQWHRALLTKDKGILYEDTYLQVGLQARLTRSRGELLLYLGNKQAGQAISGLALALAAAPPQLQVVLGQLPPQLAPKQQVQVLVQVTCLAPFAEPPRLRLAYSSGGRLVAQELLLPLGCHKFLEPQPHIARDGFFEQWKAYSGPPLKLQQMVERPSPLGVEATLGLLRGLHWGVEHGYLDPSPHNEAGAGLFVAGPPGGEGALLCQCRVEGNPQNRMQFRVTVAAPDAMLAAGLRDVLVAQLLAAP